MVEKLPLTTPNPAEERLAALKDLFPEAFAEGKLNLDKLKLLLGEHVELGRERYGLSWAGKSEAVQAVQIPSTATLRPMRGESVEFDTSENVIIEGDNLEALKLLQKAYHGRVKLIYIDPPYNTGNDFVYPDNFRDSTRQYLEFTGQVSADGVKLTTNNESGGRFHSKWLSMMYPRLQLARALLKDDGAIFVSLDDNEIYSLRQIMNEIFGEENFVATVIWQKVYSPKNSAMYFSEDHDYIVVYAKNAETWRPKLLPRTEEANARYENPDNDERGNWKPADLTARNYYSDGQYEVTSPSGKKFKPSVGRYWSISRLRFKELDEDNRIWWGLKSDAMPQVKRFLTEVRQGVVPQTLWHYADVGHTQDAKKELLEFVPYEETDNVIDTVKPTQLLRRILQIATEPSEEHIVVDFFGGSGSTGHAVLAQNAEDGGNRRFILVQLPEVLPTPESKLKTIADVTRARVRNVGEKIKTGLNGSLDLHSQSQMDLGFRAFKLDSSNFRVWDSGGDDIQGQLEALVGNLVEGRSQEDVLFELMLKAGFALSSRVEELEVNAQRVYSVARGKLLVCLDTPVQAETLRGMMALKPEQVLALDVAFEGDDALKTNIVLEMRDAGIAFRTV